MKMLVLLMYVTIFHILTRSVAYWNIVFSYVRKVFVNVHFVDYLLEIIKMHTFACVRKVFVIFISVDCLLKSIKKHMFAYVRKVFVNYLSAGCLLKAIKKNIYSKLSKNIFSLMYVRFSWIVEL